MNTLNEVVRSSRTISIRHYKEQYYSLSPILKVKKQLQHEGLEKKKG